ncbi:ECF-type sigma factor [Paraglaciecola arctica]|uniref:RNA polymerase, sigma-24 subunit, ECF subfamily n=1 Tax=Paraglaciecola arctica BSs20135 TaxID=493475 RepID=K6YR53_9ALTE|nr:ECF-type sigma factor [Paraglaciecola arctica]GAC20657.1 RNA polymerase, sigma-24 subunit, ECF subfamily [Paraglaciecola arctica BSs20135]
MTAKVCKENITELLSHWQDGDEAAMTSISNIVYSELERRARIYMSRERAGHTLETAALVNEVFLSLFDANVSFVDRQHFYTLASRTMRRILVDHARSISSKKRGANALKITLNTELNDAGFDLSQFLSLHNALERLIELDERKAKILELDIFAGLNIQQIADLYGVSVRTIERELKFSKAWVYRELALVESA